MVYYAGEAMHSGISHDLAGSSSSAPAADASLSECKDLVASVVCRLEAVEKIASGSPISDSGNMRSQEGFYILNLETGATTPFVKKEGIYIFTMWEPPLSESPFGRPR